MSRYGWTTPKARSCMLPSASFNSGRGTHAVCCKRAHTCCALNNRRYHGEKYFTHSSKELISSSSHIDVRPPFTRAAIRYDSSRVQLTVNDEDNSDYINANYMPGYDNASKQYIAAQGPLPSTVNDFWRMVWEKRSQAIVMVTNCTESGRIKCEQYWPLDYTPCLYGNLVVTVKSESKAPSWTLREFNVKNKSTSETRTVKHFHFTAWPDHGVPSGTEELIQFRGLVRQHIESSFSAGPTVVHCSAGVGRTGTLIALDVLLQQLDREKAVGTAAFVQQMRFCRPLMVQTESQYVFLHQCIMDSLQPKVVAKSEPLYENSDMIYVNAIALRQYENGSKI
ncbi:Receptor-type tyrosine-protein phosphatase H [Anabarilius grahami]|uniref:protein-tyrosine-phosphatase n=1 Tax=Anabarilius grahami TaxID=495550 RepID=A0A3N0YZG4_ANAGA|nr:Receptor-type tyrosine-protein phosphatase H [Anabarilius grahami]